LNKRDFKMDNELVKIKGSLEDFSKCRKRGINMKDKQENKIEELEGKIKHIEEKVVQIDRLDKENYQLTQKLSKAMNLLISLVEKAGDFNENDIDYVLLKLDIDPILYHELSLLISRTQILYRKIGEFPKLTEFHRLVIDTLNLTKEDELHFSINITESLLNVYGKDEDNLFPVCQKILSTKYSISQGAGLSSHDRAIV